jgi:hypothetical protein
MADLRDYFKVSPSAKRYSEQFFQHLYRQTLEAELLKSQRMAEPNEPSVDETQARQQFDEKLEVTTHFFKSVFPEDLLKQAADVRVLALGYCSPPVKKAINKFLNQYAKIYSLTEQAHEKQMELNELSVGERVMLFHELDETTVFSAQWEGEDLVLQASDWDQAECPDAVLSFRFLRAELLELDVENVEKMARFDCLKTELYRARGGFDFHLLLTDPSFPAVYYYCTIHAKTLRVSDVNGRELKGYDDYLRLEEQLEAKYLTDESSRPASSASVGCGRD